MKTIVIDPGHGGTDSGATSQGYFEKNFNLSIASKVRDFLFENYEVKIVMTRGNDTTVSLQARSDLANAQNADFFLSIHNNAGGGTGFESFIFNGTVSTITHTYQDVIHNQIINAIASKYNVTNRGKKRANFHVLRETRMPALLLEVLFVDNNRDLSLLRNNTFINDVSIAIGQGVARALNLSVKTSPDGLFKVIAGSFTERKNAEDRVEYLSQRKISSFIVPTTISGVQYYRVQAGAFASRENAELQVEALKAAGITDAYIISDTVSPPTPPPPTPEERFTIQGVSLLNAFQLDHFVKTVNPNAPLLGEHYIKYGAIYGVRGDVAYAQAMHETDYFRFTGLVDKNQNNFAGIGATGPGNPGATFKTPEEGVHAHIQHLFAYSSKQNIPPGYEKVDPRFDLVTRGSATTWTQLNGKWAVPGTTYGQSIISLFKRNATYTIGQIEKQVEDLQNLLKEIE
ncbi:N-acetylmuramoyl-L-alanine amidase [Halobacillus sp. Marseille-Q1614]|uniref:N-acetylmuramoyl-L-alanine amidase n=1 Tax=Halobacillus sp. Marseille-Q1614 TaxID=2709134 RepID=UPI00156FDEF9|nr:N-acetylmuramoyl-L-alanine amidase [Halobacillus sp. Marseille-Q1614]